MNLSSPPSSHLLEPFLRHVLATQYPQKRTLPLVVIMLIMRLHIHVDLAPSLTRKLVHHARTSSKTERDSLLRELRACPCMALVLAAIESDPPQDGHIVLTALAPPNTSSAHLLGAQASFLPFSQSAIWTTQQRYYERRQLAAWTEGDVPHSISSNPFVAELYLTKIAAALLGKFLSDDKACEVQAGGRLRLAITELGAGHGILSILLTRHLRVRSMGQRIRDLWTDKALGQEPLCPPRGVPIDTVVVATDFQGKIFEQLVALPWVAELCQGGGGSGTGSESAVMSFAAPGAAGALCYISPSGRGGECVEPCDVLVVVGNYILDSLSVDIFVALPAEGGGGSLVEVGVAAGVEGRRKRARARGEGCRAAEMYVGRIVPPLAPEGHNDDDDDMESFHRFAHAQLSLGQACPSRMLPYPVGCLELLRRVSTAFPPRPFDFNLKSNPNSNSNSNSNSNLNSNRNRPVILLVGDYLMPSDDRAWLASSPVCGGAFGCPQGLADSVTRTDLAGGSASLLPVSLDLPFISPTPECTALPVVPESVSWAFARVFGGAHGEDSTVMGTGLELPELCGSKFSVLEISTLPTIPAPSHPPHVPSSSPARPPNPNPNPNRPPSFGPNDLMVLREIVADLKYTRGGGCALEFLQGCLVLSSWDPQLFLDGRTRWLVLRHLRNAAGAAAANAAAAAAGAVDVSDGEAALLSLVTAWIQLLMRCCGCVTIPSPDPDSDPSTSRSQGSMGVHRYWGPYTSLEQLRCARLDCLQWLSAVVSVLASEGASRACRSVAVSGMLALLATDAPLQDNAGDAVFPLVLPWDGPSGGRVALLGPQEGMLLSLALRQAPGLASGGDVAALAVAVRGHTGRPKGSKKHRGPTYWHRVKMRCI